MSKSKQNRVFMKETVCKRCDTVRRVKINQNYRTFIEIVESRTVWIFKDESNLLCSLFIT